MVMARGQSPHRNTPTATPRVSAPVPAERPKSYGAVGDIWESLRDELRSIEKLPDQSIRLGDLVDERIKQMAWPEVCSLLADLEFEMDVNGANGVQLYEEPDTYGTSWSDESEDDHSYADGYASSRSWSEFLDEMIEEGTPRYIRDAEEAAGEEGEPAAEDDPDAEGEAPSAWERRCAALSAIDPTKITVAEADWDYHFEYGSSCHKDESTLDEMLRNSAGLFLTDKLRKRLENDPLLCDWEWSDLTARAEAFRASRRD